MQLNLYLFLRGKIKLEDYVFVSLIISIIKRTNLLYYILIYLYKLTFTKLF